MRNFAFDFICFFGENPILGQHERGIYIHHRGTSRRLSYGTTGRGRRVKYFFVCRRPTINLYDSIGHPALAGEKMANENLRLFQSIGFHGIARNTDASLASIIGL
jgi:hypothetical protein